MRLVSAILLAIALLAAPGRDLPSAVLSDASGKDVPTGSLIDHKTPFVVSFWMTTCKPCVKELDTLTDELELLGQVRKCYGK
ncbi:MAG: hypothetical protein J6O51_03195 [Bacteroidales bacterium]|nr:hypothetical protein [Bacteroidales bacterium]